jgi:hypothetical protein
VRRLDAAFVFADLTKLPVHQEHVAVDLMC